MKFFANSIFFAHFLVFSNLFAQNPAFKNHTPVKEKTSATVYTFLQDDKGYLWLGTSNGLISYNGIEFYTHFFKDRLADNVITSLCPGGKDTIWVGHSSGQISVLKNNIPELFNPPEGVPAKKITAIKRDLKGRTWFATYGEGIYYYDGERMHGISSDDGLSDNSVYTIFIDNEQKVWAGTDGGITIINLDEEEKSGRIKKLSMKDGLPDNIVKFLSQDKNGIMWIAMQDSGICKYSITENRFEKALFADGWNYGSVSSFVIDRMGALWIGTTESLVQYFPTTSAIRLFNSKNGIINDKIFSLLEDREHNIWIGTAAGISQYSGNRFEFLTQKDGLLSNNVFSFITDSKGHYWIGSDQGVTEYSSSGMGKVSVKNYSIKNGLSHPQVVSIFEDKESRIWLGTYGGGACKLDPLTRKVQVYSEKNGLANNNVMSIASDKEGNLWFATLGGGVSRMSLSGEIKNFTSADGLGSDYVYFVFNDSKNNMWFASDVLTKYDGKQFKLFSDDPEIEGKTIFSIDEDTHGNIWLSASESGIFKYDGNTFQNFSSGSGLRDESPTVLVCDENDNVIIGHKSGIDKFNPATNSFNYFGNEEGLLSFEPNLNAVYKQQDGNIWIGTTNGTVKYNTSDELNNPIEPLTQITRFRVLTDEVALQADAAFEHHRNNITFDFIGLSLTAPQKVRYRVKLENFNADWLPETPLTSQNYPYLPPGKYKFLVKSCNNEGVWNQNPVAFEFIIMPPYWQTWWFWTILITCIFSAAYIYIKWKVKKIETEKKILEQKVQDRTKEILEQKKIIEEKNKNITDSINYAKRIQDAILPPQKFVNSHLKNSFILYKPKDIVAGDFYWLAPLNPPEGGNNTAQAGGIVQSQLPPSEGGGAVLFACCDCTGHGVPGAFVSIVGHNALNSCVKEFGLTQPAQILDKLNDLVEGTFSKAETDVKDGMDIALVKLAMQNGSWKMEYSGANNSFYFIRNGILKEIIADKQPIGKFIGRKPFTNHEYELQKDDSIYIFSDGYADQFGGPKGKKFKYKQIEELLVSIQHKSMDEQKQILNDTIVQWKGNLEQVDDICVIGIRV